MLKKKPCSNVEDKTLPVRKYIECQKTEQFRGNGCPQDCIHMLEKQPCSHMEDKTLPCKENINTQNIKIRNCDFIKYCSLKRSDPMFNHSMDRLHHIIQFCVNRTTR